MKSISLNTHKINFLKEQFRQPLPGVRLQNKMSPIIDNSRYREAPLGHKVACVIALLHHKENELFVTYIKRATTHPDDKHSGQIGFPGGKYEEEDGSLLQCAIRETSEEIGVILTEENVVGGLTPLYVFASNFMVYPFVAYYPIIPSYIRQESEVADILEIPVSHLLEPDKKIKNHMKLSNSKKLEVPGYDVNGEFLWGATAMISSELEAILGRELI